MAWIPAALAVAGLLFLTLQPPQDTMRLSTAVRQWLIGRFGSAPDMHTLRSWAHLPEFFALGICFWIGWSAVITDPKKAALATLLTCALIGLADEGLKYFLPTREFDGLDWSIDLIGIALGLGAVWLFNGIMRGWKKQNV